MNKRDLQLVTLSLLIASTKVRAEDFRVELYSKNPPSALTIRAGAAAVRICPPAHKQPCLVLDPGATAQCRPANSRVRCEAGNRIQDFGLALLTSTKPFSLNVAGGQGAGGEQPPSMALRELHLQSAKRALRVVAIVDLETYVTGVLAGEAATLKSAPALAAMAVIARTWALKSQGRHKSSGFDFCSLTHCQFFRPASDVGNSDAVIRAETAAKTSGVILMYHGQLVDAYYGANCGGMTESAGDVWADRRAPYLQSVSDPYCAGGAAASWLQTISIADVSEVLRELPGVSFAGPLRDMAITNHDASGRARTLRLVGNTSTQVDANAFRYAVNRRLGWNTLKSNLYTVEHHNGVLVFTGRGLGHGVGLCQTGAEQMGRMGISYDKILAHYFPGTNLGHSDEHGATRILSSEHFEIVFPPRQERWAANTLEVLEASRVKLGNRVSLMPTRTRIRAWETTAEFIRVTRQPGWVAGSNDGHLIDLQPLDLLKHKGILESTLRHELTHLVVRRHRASQVPRWYEEGLVLFLTGEPVGNSSRVLDPRRSLELSISEPRSESEMRAAYAEAAERVRDLARRRGEAAVWQALERPSGEDLKWFRNPK